MMATDKGIQRHGVAVRLVRQVPGNSLPQQDLLQPERVKGTVPFSLRKACAKIGTVPDHWYIFSWDLP